MSFYEHTIIAKHDLSSKDVDNIKNRYIEFINNSEGEIIKTEEWGLLNFVKKIKNSRKGFYIHFKFKAKPSTILELSFYMACYLIYFMFLYHYKHTFGHI